MNDKFLLTLMKAAPDFGLSLTGCVENKGDEL